MSTKDIFYYFYFFPQAFKTKAALAAFEVLLGLKEGILCCVHAGSPFSSCL